MDSGCNARFVTGTKCGAIGLAFVAVAMSFSSCSVGTLFREEMVKEKAMVLLTDSMRWTGKTVLPDYRKKKLRFVTSEGKRVRLESGKVKELRFRHDDVLDVFVYLPYVDRSGKERDVAWMNCQGRGTHLRIALMGASWHFTRKGELEPVSFANGDVYIVGIKNGEKGHYIANLGRTKVALGRALCKFLADDPELCAGISSGEVNVFDFQEICRRYVPRRRREDGLFEVRLSADKEEDAKGGTV